MATIIAYSHVWPFQVVRVKTLVAGRLNLLVRAVLRWSSCFTPRPIRAKLWNLPLSVSVCGLSRSLRRFRFWKSHSVTQDVGVFTPVLPVTKSYELHVGARCKHAGWEILNSRATVYWDQYKVISWQSPLQGFHSVSVHGFMADP